MVHYDKPASLLKRLDCLNWWLRTWLNVCQSYFFCTIDIFATKLGVCYVQYLGVHLDKTLLVKQHISGLCHITFLTLIRITSIWPFLSNSFTAKLVASMITLRLDYCNAAFTGVPDKEIPTRSIVHTFTSKFTWILYFCQESSKSLKHTLISCSLPFLLHSFKKILLFISVLIQRSATEQVQSLCWELFLNYTENQNKSKLKGEVEGEGSYSVCLQLLFTHNENSGLNLTTVYQFYLHSHSYQEMMEPISSDSLLPWAWTWQ